MVAAFELTRPELAGRFEVTVYQPGWRLGGKGASGRGLNGASRRIEEHGLHVWFGFYENAFAVMRDAYQELAANGDTAGPFRTVWDASRPARRSSLSTNRARTGSSSPYGPAPIRGYPGTGLSPKTSGTSPKSW
jgi:uncharacterized protein with NAD-binding domain and iron-sulfur cluster